jgi:hypothetical protein
MRGALEERLHVAEEIADDPEGRPADRLKALEFLARFGLGSLVEARVCDADRYDYDEEAHRLMETRLAEDPELTAALEDVWTRLYSREDPLVRDGDD